MQGRRNPGAASFRTTYTASGLLQCLIGRVRPQPAVTLESGKGSNRSSILAIVSVTPQIPLRCRTRPLIGAYRPYSDSIGSFGRIQISITLQMMDMLSSFSPGSCRSLACLNATSTLPFAYVIRSWSLRPVTRYNRILLRQDAHQ